MDSHKQFVGVENRREDRKKEIPSKDHSRANRGVNLNLRVEHERRKRQLRRGVRMCEATTKRAALTDRIVPDRFSRVRQHRAVVMHQIAAAERGVPRQRSDRQSVILKAKLTKFLQAIDIDE